MAKSMPQPSRAFLHHFARYPRLGEKKVQARLDTDFLDSRALHKIEKFA